MLPVTFLGCFIQVRVILNPIHTYSLVQSRGFGTQLIGSSLDIEREDLDHLPIMLHPE